ncbi:MAG: hypothetical protein AAF736_20895 [Pseudomonadota bacterium]
MKSREPERKPAAKTRKPYRRPELIPRGDVRDVTLGPTPGVGESGNPGTLRP